MDFLTEPQAREIGVLVSTHSNKDAGYQALLQVTAVLALQGPVRVLDCGNRFDVYQVARQVRRHTPQLTETLNQISIARAFTCYQVITLLTDTALTSEPAIIIDLLSTFYDENVSLAESHRLLNIVLDRIKAMRHLAPVLISAHPRPERPTLVTAVCQAADHVLVHKQPPAYQHRPLL